MAKSELLNEQIDQDQALQRQEQMVEILHNKREALKAKLKELEAIKNPTPDQMITKCDVQEEILTLDWDIEAKTEQVIDKMKARRKGVEEHLEGKKKASKSLVKESKENFKELIKEARRLIKKYPALNPVIVKNLQDIDDEYYSGKFKDDYDRAGRYAEMKEEVETIKDQVGS